MIQNGLAVLVAWLLNAGLRGQIAVRALVFLPVVLGATINGLTWYVMFNPLGGAVTMALAAARHPGESAGQRPQPPSTR